VKPGDLGYMTEGERAFYRKMSGVDKIIDEVVKGLATKDRRAARIDK